MGEHESYSGNGYVYEFRGRLNEIQRNLSDLHRLEWIDNSTRAIFIQMSLYNPNVQLFTSVMILAEILSTGGIYPTARFEPMNFTGKYIQQFYPKRNLSLFSIYFPNSIDLYHHLHNFHHLFSHKRNSNICSNETFVFLSISILY